MTAKVDEPSREDGEISEDRGPTKSSTRKFNPVPVDCPESFGGLTTKQT